MAVSLRASVSADALTIAAAFLTLATVAKLAGGPEPSRPARDFWVLGLSAGVLCATKLPYAPLAAAVLLIPARRWPGGRRGPALAAILACAVAATAWSVAVAASLHVELRPETDRGRQIHDAFAEPLRAASVIAADAWTHGPRYLAQLVGVQLGWLDTRLPWLLVLSYMALLAWLAMADTEGGDGTGLRAKPRLFLAALALSVTVLVIASQYAAFTPYRAASVDGVQGRYFLPLLPAAALVLRGRGVGAGLSSRGVFAALAAFAAAAAAATCLAVIARFYG
ncbi:MAG TPA: DUF2142 domain-containing protein [Thermoanaerobaculia bacterium]|nr:DUF2142 domain-containing protein [Thermoanaerobaculia bacterium]